MVDGSADFQQSFIISICFVSDLKVTTPLTSFFFVTITPHVYDCMAVELLLSLHEKFALKERSSFSVYRTFDTKSIVYGLFSNAFLDCLEMALIFLNWLCSVKQLMYPIFTRKVDL